MIRPHLQVLLPWLCLLTACPSADEAGPAPYVQPAPWEELSPAQRDEFMERLFTPRMAEEFRDFDPETYEVFGCVTCHGPDGEDDGYAMPADLGSIGLGDLPVENIEDPTRREVAMWMDEVILPEMGRLFEQELTLEGASCLDCHPFDASLP